MLALQDDTFSESRSWLEYFGVSSRPRGFCQPGPSNVTGDPSRGIAQLGTALLGFERKSPAALARFRAAPQILAREEGSLIASLLVAGFCCAGVADYASTKPINVF
jgi:hypothetical protein